MLESLPVDRVARALQIHHVREDGKIVDACIAHRPDHKGRERQDSDEKPVRRQKTDTSPEQALCGALRFFLHHVGVSRLDTQGKSGKGVGDQIDPKKVDSLEGDRPTEQDGEKEGYDLADVAGEQEEDRLFDVGEDVSSFFDRRDDGRKVVVGQNHA